MLPPLTYLSFDSLAEGVGASQVAAYVERLAARDIEVHLHTFEKGTPDPALVVRLADHGVHWTPHDFGPLGSRGGAMRVVRGARILRGAPLVHARSDMAAGAAMLARVPHWIWDVRSFWAEQRIAMGALGAGSLEARVFRSIEHRAGRQARGLVTLTAAAQRTLGERHGPALLTNAAVIPTCVELERFPCSRLPDRGPIVLMLSGSLNRYYDVPAMIRLRDAMRAQTPTELVVLAPGATTWDAELGAGGVTPRSVEYAQIPVEIAAAHAGLSVCRPDAGPSLQAAVPTKIAEFLASGRPVVVNRGLGDFDELLPGSGAGVVLDGAGDDAIARAAGELRVLLASPDTPASCSAFAAAHFDLDVGIVRLVEVYRRAVASG